MFVGHWRPIDSPRRGEMFAQGVRMLRDRTQTGAGNICPLRARGEINLVALQTCAPYGGRRK